MPVTPFHFGPGLLVKSVARKRFSFFTFLLSQIIIDMETAWNMIQGNPRLHTFFHTFLGSLVAVAITYFLAKPAAKISTAFFFLLPRVQYPFKSVLNLSSWTVVISALIGGWSHVLLDGVMHFDLQPFSPLSDTNPFLRFISIQGLHLFCVFSAVLGVFIWGLSAIWQRTKKSQYPDI